MTCIILYSGIICKFPHLASEMPPPPAPQWYNCIHSHTQSKTFLKCYFDSGSDFLLSFLKGVIENPTLAGRPLPLTFPSVSVGDDSGIHLVSVGEHKHFIVQQRAKALNDLKAYCSCSWSFCSTLNSAVLHSLLSTTNTSQFLGILPTSPSH